MNKPILVVEDSDADFEALERAFRKTGVINPIFRCNDGDEAINYLKNTEKFSDINNSPKPCIILLDLNMPGLDGFDVLDIIKVEAELKSLPVIVLTTSNDQKDIRKAYEKGANSYIQKPVQFDGFIEAIKKLKSYWFELNIVSD